MYEMNQLSALPLIPMDDNCIMISVSNASVISIWLNMVPRLLFSSDVGGYQSYQSRFGGFMWHVCTSQDVWDIVMEETQVRKSVSCNLKTHSRIFECHGQVRNSTVIGKGKRIQIFQYWRFLKICRDTPVIKELQIFGTRSMAIDPLPLVQIIPVVVDQKMSMF